MLSDYLVRIEEDLTHQLWQVAEVVFAFDDSFTNIFVDVSEVSVVVFESDETIVNHFFLHGKHVFLGVAE